MAHRGVELLRVLPKRAVAVQTDDLCLGPGGLGANREGQPHPIVPKGPELGRWPPDAGATRVPGKSHGAHPWESQAHRTKKESSP